MTQPPEGAQLSDDGYYWWDGSQWQPVAQPGAGGAAGGSMAFPDGFVSCLSQNGIMVDAGSLPDQGTLQQALDSLQSWLDSLDPTWQAGVDAATTNDAASVVLADPSVNLAPGIQALLQAFDTAQGKPLSELLQTARSCLSQGQ